MNKIWLIIVGVVVIGAGYWLMNSKNSDDVIVQDDDVIAEIAGVITLDNFTPNQNISSPLQIQGQAIGPWYFEAVFDVELKDGNGIQIATSLAEAQSDWMVTGLVPFDVTLTYTTPATTTGTLIFHKANPSGEPQNDDQLVVPVTF